MVNPLCSGVMLEGYSKGLFVGNGSYTCQDYRQEMILLGLQRRLHDANLSDEERQRVMEEIRMLESEMQIE